MGAAESKDYESTPCQRDLSKTPPKATTGAMMFDQQGDPKQLENGQTWYYGKVLHFR